METTSCCSIDVGVENQYSSVCFWKNRFVFYLKDSPEKNEDFLLVII
jgi:hypothetical protein